VAEHNHYVPILKGRRGEYTALTAVPDEARAQMTPLIEVAPVPWDFEKERASKSIDLHLRPVVSDVEKCWGTDRPVFIDLLWISQDATASGEHPVSTVFGDARAKGVRAIPVAGVSRPVPYLDAIRGVVHEDRQGVCLRLELQELRNMSLLASSLRTVCHDLVVEPDSVDLILDFKDFDANQAAAIEMAAGVALTALPDPTSWRSLTLAGGGFPLNLTGVTVEARIVRADWEVWRSLAIDRADEMPRRPAFADYAVQHPEPREIDPRLMKMSAALRYTTPSEWLVLKGKNVQDHGFEQFHDLCADLIGREEFRGADFSDGDRAIQDAADRKGGPGNATTWRKIATNHHLATVVDQIAKLP
jgi:hypothetical protein